MGRVRHRRGAARRAAAVGTTLAVLLGTSSQVAARSTDQSAGQELLDRAIESLEFGDDDAYEHAVENIRTSSQWFPTTLQQALEERDIELIIMVWFVSGAPDTEVLRTAIDMASFERDALALGDPDSALDRIQLEQADRQGLTALETIEHRGLSTTDAMTAALSLLPANNDNYPDARVYDVAIRDLAADIAGTPVALPASPTNLSAENPGMHVGTDTRSARSATTAAIGVAPETETAILEDALIALRAELAAIERLDNGSVATDELRTDLMAADNAGALVLERANKAGVEISPEALFVLSRLPRPDRTTPRVAADYERAIEMIGNRLANSALPVGTYGPRDAGPIPGPGPIFGAPLGADTVTNIGPGTSSGPATAAPWIALGGISVLALLLGFFAFRRNREALDLAGLANTDGLTGLQNRRKFDSDVDKHRQRGDTPVALLMVDVDRFKNVNDLYGHSTGDEVLRLVGEALTGSLRRHDLAYRYGGEEFCALLPGTFPEEAQHVAERIRSAVEALDLPVDARLTASVGIASGSSSQLDTLVEQADTALYTAKAAGRNRVVSV